MKLVGSVSALDLFDLIFKSTTSIPVPSGFVAISPGGFEYLPGGRPVPAGKGERTWDEFVVGAKGRKWQIETRETEEGKGSGRREGAEEPQFINRLPTNFTKEDVEQMRERYEERYKELRELGTSKREIAKHRKRVNSILDSLLARIEGPKEERQYVDRDVAGLVDLANSKGAIAFEKDGKIVVEFGKTRAAEKSRVVDAGGIVFALVNSLGGAEAHLVEGKGKFSKTFDLAELFPNSGKRVEELNKMFLDHFSISETSRGASVSSGASFLFLVNPSTEDLVYEGLKEQLARLKESPNLELGNFAKTAEKILASRDVIHSIETGNFLVQAALELTTLSASGVKASGLILQKLDELFVLGDGSTTLSSLFEEGIRGAGEILSEEHLNNLRMTFRGVIDAHFLNPRQDPVTIKEREKKLFEIASLFKKDSAGILLHMVLFNSRDNDPSIRKLFSSQENDWGTGKSAGERGKSFKEDFGPKLAEKIVALIGEASNILGYVKGEGFARELAGYMAEIKLPEAFREIAMKKIVERIETNLEPLKASFGEVGLKRTSELAGRGFSALLIHALTAMQARFNPAMTLSHKSITSLVHALGEDTLKGYNSSTGYFHGETQEVFAEILNRVRFLPNLDDLGKFIWVNALRDIAKDRFIKGGGKLNEDGDVDDATLIRHLSYDKDAMPANIFLAANIHTLAATLRGKDGTELLSREELTPFRQSVQATNLLSGDGKILKDLERALRGASVTLGELAGGTIVDMSKPEVVSEAWEHLLSDNHLEACKKYSISSLAQLLKKKVGEEVTKDDVTARRNYLNIVEGRINALGKGKVGEGYAENLLDYVKSSIALYGDEPGETKKIKGVKIRNVGQVFEALSAIPMLNHFLEDSGADKASIKILGQAGDNPLLGLTWTGKDGATYSFGKMKDAPTGAVDYMLIREAEDGIYIVPGEGKMAERGNQMPLHGNPEDFAELVVNLWKKHGKKIIIEPSMVINMPSQTNENSVTTHTLSLDFPVTWLQATGRSLTMGLLATADMLQSIGTYTTDHTLYVSY